ncbi:hypothetical protein Kintu_gp33c [Xanthomonas phage Kintu]
MNEIKRYDWVEDGMSLHSEGDFVLHSDHEAEIARLRAEVEAYRKDAERYRWLRNPDRDVSLVLDKVTGYIEYHEGTQTGGYSTYEYRAGEELDTAIDAAMGASA